MECINCNEEDPNTSTVVCYGERADCTNCTKPPRFDTTEATSHPELTNIIGGPQGFGANKIEQKFAYIHQELEKRHTNTHLFFIPVFILILASAGVNSYLANTYKMQCQFAKLCNDPRQRQFSTISPEAQCPSSSDWAVDCCYTYCFDHRPFVDGLADYKRGCYPIASINDDIQKNKPFYPECNCVKVKTRTGIQNECGGIKFYGKFNDIPGSYASPRVMRYIKPITTIVPFIITIIAAILNQWYRTHRTNKIIQDCLEDWQILGITAEFKRRRKGRREQIVLNIPSLPIAPPYSSP